MTTKPNYFTCTLGQAAALTTQQPYSTINDLIDAKAREQPYWPAIGFSRPAKTPDDEWTRHVFSFSDIKRGSDHLASQLLHDHGETLSRRQTVGLLCPSTPEFLFTWLALMRLGHAVLLIAPQCPAAAIASLCETCNVSVLLHDDVHEVLVRETRGVMTEANQRPLTVAELPLPKEGDWNALIPKEIGHVNPPTVPVKDTDIAYLHHTSGTSSGMPKPIPQTHRAGIGVLPIFPDGHDVATFTTTPLYHGGIADLFRAWTSNALIWLFPGKGVPITASNITKCLDITCQAEEEDGMPPVKYFSSVPYVLQMMEADPRGLQYLRIMDIVGVGGAALPAEVGDRLVECGVNLISRFGSAECGFLMSSHREYAKDKEWQYLRSEPGGEHLGFEAAADGLFELVVKAGWPHMAKRNRADGSYATADLFAPHPSIPHAWRYHSRADSQLTLVTGKKFDPAPLEAAMATSELLDDVLIFGNGKPFPGALLFRSKTGKSMSDGELIVQIWPVVEKLSSESQHHARLSKGMVVPMPALDRPLEKSSKGTLVRGAVEKRFQDEIEDAYAALESDTGAPEVPDEELPATIKAIITSTVSRQENLDDTTDLFSFGVDSVASMQIRHRLRRLLHKDAPQLAISVVEDCGDVERLAAYILRLRRGEGEINGTVETNVHDYMRELVEQYSDFDNPHPTRTSEEGDLIHRTEGDVVVLTGATGALGAHVLDQYRAVDSVRRIYCLVRGANAHASYERINKALVQRKLRPLDKGDVGRIIVLQAQLGDLQLGLHSRTYVDIAREATVIMHAAWSVNFRMKLRSFVRDNIAGMRNLINLALASPKAQPPRFIFCSSVASVTAYPYEPVPEAIVDDASAATELGYSQSKWVAEQICARATYHTRLNGRVSVLRVGQLSGDSTHGIWNSKEAWPMMLSAVNVTRSLPMLDNEVLSWLPVDMAATALIESVAYQDVRGQTAVFHVLNDNTKPTWATLLTWLKRRESFDTVTPSEWIERLEKAGRDGSDHAGLQLLGHWRKAFTSRDQKGQVHRNRLETKSFAMAWTKASLPVLRNVEPVDEAYFGKLWDWIKDNV